MPDVGLVQMLHLELVAVLRLAHPLVVQVLCLAHGVELLLHLHGGPARLVELCFELPLLQRIVLFDSTQGAFDELLLPLPQLWRAERRRLWLFENRAQLLLAVWVVGVDPLRLVEVPKLSSQHTPLRVGAGAVRRLVACRVAARLPPSVHRGVLRGRPRPQRRPPQRSAAALHARVVWTAQCPRRPGEQTSLDFVRGNITTVKSFVKFVSNLLQWCTNQILVVEVRTRKPERSHGTSQANVPGERRSHVRIAWPDVAVDDGDTHGLVVGIGAGLRRRSRFASGARKAG
jgi:hypothetical protein